MDGNAGPEQPNWAARAHELFPAGSNGEYDLPPELVSVFERADGCRVWDSDGREYLDYTMAWGSALVGHAHPQVADAVARAATSSSSRSPRRMASSAWSPCLGRCIPS